MAVLMVLHLLDVILLNVGLCLYDAKQKLSLHFNSCKESLYKRLNPVHEAPPRAGSGESEI